MRAVAVLLVFFAHYSPDRLPGGFIGVSVFFVLSGYLITSLLLAEHERFDRVALTAFYARRALRLYPALVCATVGGVVVALATGDGTGEVLTGGLATLTYTTNIVEVAGVTVPDVYNHTWSLGVEEQFYIVWPLVVILAMRGRSTVALTVGLVLGAAVVGRAALTGSVSEGSIYILPIGHLDDLMVGCALAAALRTTVRADLLRACRHRVVPLTAAAIVAAVALKASIYDLRWLQDGGETVVAVAVAGLIVHTVAAPHGISTRFLASRPLAWLGRRSYGIYLYHQILLIALAAHLGIGPRTVVGLPLTIALAAGSYRWVETPFLRKKLAFTPLSRPGQRLDPVVATAGAGAPAP